MDVRATEQVENGGTAQLRRTAAAALGVLAFAALPAPSLARSAPQARFKATVDGVQTVTWKRDSLAGRPTAAASTSQAWQHAWLSWGTKAAVRLTVAAYWHERSSRMRPEVKALSSPSPRSRYHWLVVSRTLCD